MDYAWFMKQRINFIRQLYSDSTAIFMERMQLIEAEQPPFEPPYSEDGEPAFQLEWKNASDSVRVLGYMCLSMLAGNLHICVKGLGDRFEVNIGSSKKGGWLIKYQEAFAENLGIRFEDSGVDLKVLEQLILARNQIQHTGDLHDFRLEHSSKTLDIFLDDSKFSPEWMGKTLHIDANRLEVVFSEVERFSAWLDKTSYEQFYRPKLRS